MHLPRVSKDIYDMKRLRISRLSSMEAAALATAAILMLLTLYEVGQRSHGYKLRIRPEIDVAWQTEDQLNNGTQAAPGARVITKAYQCRAEENAEYEGEILKTGAENLQLNAAACCASCSATPGCNVWVWCAWRSGCGPDRKYRECWLKSSNLPAVMLQEGYPDTSKIGWTSGSNFNAAVRNWLESEEQDRLEALRDNKALPLVYLDIGIKGVHVGRIEIVLFADVTPLAAENFRALCTGEMGNVPAGHRGKGKQYHFKGAAFYLIIDKLMNLAGAETDSIFGGTFIDEPAGLALKHDRKGLLSMANDGPNSNTADWAMLMGPAPSLDGKYVIFGEIVSGMDVAYKVNALARGKPNKAAGREAQAVILDSGQLHR